MQKRFSEYFKLGIIVNSTGSAFSISTRIILLWVTQKPSLTKTNMGS